MLLIWHSLALTVLMGEGYLEESQANCLGAGDLLLARDRLVLLVTCFARGQHAELSPGECCSYISSQYKKEGRHVVRNCRSRGFSCLQGLD